MRLKINEDKRAQRYVVLFSDRVKQYIADVDEYNDRNVDGLFRWYKYLVSLISYLSHTAIAWGNTGGVSSNKVKHIKALGHDVSYSIKNYQGLGTDYIEIIRLDYHLDEFGLKSPYDPNITVMELEEQRKHKYKQTIHIKESQLRRLVRECLYEAIRNN